MRSQQRGFGLAAFTVEPHRYVPNDQIVGTPGDDTLTGTAGRDKIDGGTGADLMIGGLDNDTYIVDNAGDVVTELAGEGKDTVRSGIDYALGANVEKLELTGTAVVGTGNELKNIIRGHDGFNQLFGGEGNDTIYGYGGPLDELHGDDGNDQLYGGQGNDKLWGDAGNDTLDGGASFGNSDLYGGDGDDLLLGNGATGMDGGSGNDTIHGGGGTFFAMGGNGHDVLYDGGRLSGGDGRDTLYGAEGRDTLLGGNGDDLLVGHSENVFVDELVGGGGNDTIYGVDAGEVYGGEGADWFVSNIRASFRIYDFEAGTDTFAISQTSLPVGDGDRFVEGAVAVAGPGGFSNTAELVLITTTNGAIGNATSAYEVGDTAIFVTYDDVYTSVLYFKSEGNDAVVSENELRSLASIAVEQPLLSDYVFIL